MSLNPLTPELYCKEIAQSVKFYTDILGFHILYERPEDKFAYLRREDVQLMLEQVGVGRKWISGELSYPYGRGINLQIKVSNVDVLYGNVKKANHPIFLELEEKWYRKDQARVGNRQFIVQDPDGYLLRFAQDLGSKPVEQ